MGDQYLRVADANYDGRDNGRSRFCVKTEGNFTISNAESIYNLKDNEYKVDVKNGNTSIKFGRNKYHVEPELSLRTKNFNILDGIRKADGNDKDGKTLNRADLEALKNDKALQKKLGVTVKYDHLLNLYTVTGKDDNNMYFDF